MATQGLCFFGGLDDFISASFTLTPGVSPSTGRIRILPGKVPSQNSDLLFTYGSTKIRLRNCRLDNVSATIDERGRLVWELEILDRRWTWRDFGEISGFYNVRTDEDTIQPGTEKKPQDLAKLCLEAMGEKRFDLAELPNKARPEVDWDYTNPAQALAALCERLGCIVCLGLDDRVRIRKVGEGANLPTVGLLSGEVTVDPPDPPKEIAIVGGRTRYQWDFPLEAVGLEVDGTVKRIEDLSYTPTVLGRKTWKYSDADSFTGLTNKRFRELARKSVFRWYRIKTPFRLPKVREIFRDLSRILPLETVQIETWRNPDNGLRESRPPWIYGRFWDGEAAHKDPVVSLFPDIASKPKGFYAKAFSVDSDRGLVMFGEPCYRLKNDPTVAAGKLVAAAILRLRIACNLRDKDSRAWKRQERKAKLKVKGGRDGTLYALREDVVREIYYRASPPPLALIDNLPEVNKKAEFYYNALARQYEPSESGTVAGIGLLPIQVDGAILQVTWQINDQGAATTRASRNREELIVAQSFKEARFIERLNRALKERDKPERMRAADARKRKGK